MHHRSRVLATMAGTIILATAGVGAPAQAADPPVTLRLGLGDGNGEVVVTPFVADLVEQVAKLSDSITIEPVFSANGQSPGDKYQVVAQHVIDGDFEMGLLPARTWDSKGVTSLQALQAPFLITNDALATAVASSDVARQMLDGMSSAGVVGLALYPQDLRHPFAFDACHPAPFLSPADLAGTTIGAFASQATLDMLTSLGAKPNDTASGSNDDCALDGVESGFGHRRYDPGRLTATGNVTFFPRYDVLVIDDAVYGRLTEQQQAALRQAVAIAQGDEINAHQTDADAGGGWCADGGHIVLASDAQVAAFEAASQPLYARLEQDPVTKQLIAAIRDLKAATVAGPAAAACEHPSATPSAPSASGPLAQLPPNGVYRADITAKDLIAKGAPEQWSYANASTTTLTLKDGVARCCSGAADDCYLDYSVQSDVVRFDWHAECDVESDEVRWTMDSDGLRFQPIAVSPFNGHFLVTHAWEEVRAWWDRTWTKIE